MSEQPWHSVPLNDIYKELESSKTGLSKSEAEESFKKYGPNKLSKKREFKALKIFINQFKSFLVGLLVVAIIISYFIGSTVDAVVIGIIVILNTILGFAQEFKAERAVESLKKMSAPKAIVLREGKPVEISADQLVPGDVIVINEGDRIPADARLIEAPNLETDESALTGESNSVIKMVSVFKEEKISIADRKNMVFMNTTVTRGRATAIVVSTGMSTEIGKIAKSISEQKSPPTPLQEKLSVVAKNLGFAALAISFLVFALGALRGEDLIEMFTAAISLAVAAVPEGLPAVVTITLAMGLRRMAKAKSIIRKLPVVETLGSATIICSDKTGTLTKNEMTVKQMYTNHQLINVSGSGYEPEGYFTKLNKTFDPLKNKNSELLLRAGAMCTTASLTHDHEWKIVGDPTEGALLVSSKKAGMDKESMLKNHVFVGEIPFDSGRKMMSVIYEKDGKKIAYIKGAPEILLSKSTHIFYNGSVRKLTAEDKKKIHAVLDKMTSSALRVLGIGYRYVSSSKKYTSQNIETKIIFVGLQAMIDPPRPEVKEAINISRSAGIETVMITGDHASTAGAIATELGLMTKDDKVMIGIELDKYSDDKLYSAIENVRVFARVSPEHKLRIVNTLKSKGHVVAMTGDGINDAPALKVADIGIAMGIKGTDVSKEASDMILMDDNYNSIVKAVEEGRGIFDNIKKFIRYLISCNVGEVMAIFVAMLIGLPLPLIAVQILWMNLLTDGLPALALGFDPPTRDIMLQSPRGTKEGAISKDTWIFSIFVGLSIMVSTLLLFWMYLDNGLNYARTIAFSTIVVAQMFNVFNSRDDKSIFENPSALFNNKLLLLALLMSVLLQILVVHVGIVGQYFGTVPLSLADWGFVVLAGSLVLFVIETKKKFRIKTAETQ